jgi:membrane protein implicated in regulation of membrane protease activity
MNWELFYLICFATGFIFSVLSFLSGTLHLHIHVPRHFHFGGGHVGGHGSAGAAHSHGGAAKGGARSVGNGPGFSMVNPMTLAAFLTWFGGTGYLLQHLRHVWVFFGLLLSSAAGLAGAAVVFLFVAKVLMAHDYSLNPLDYEMVGVLGRLSNPIRVGGVGEIIFLQAGARKGCAARSEDGQALPKGIEVVVTRYEGGTAFVRPWSELAETAGIPTEE